MKGLIVVLGALLATLALAASAFASSRSAADGRGDTRGSHWPGPGYTWSPTYDCWVTAGAAGCGEGDYFENQGPLLDIVSVSHGHGGRNLVHRVTMARNWQSSLLAPSVGGQVSLFFDLDRDAAFERRLDVYLRRGKPAGVVRAGSRSVGVAAVARPSRKTVQISFPRRVLGRGAVTYRWFAFAGIECRRKFDRCGDRAPSASLLRHRLL